MPTRIITGVPQDRVDQLKAIQLAGGATSVEVEPDDEGGLFKLIVTWPEGTVLTEDD